MGRGKRHSPTHDMEKEHLLNHGPTPEPVKRMAAVTVAERNRTRPDVIAELLDILGLWPDGHQRFRADEGVMCA
ncbi:hypothetical protein [Brevibacterium sp.]|uniref:hypothetical protein n=1 Tax=Brevibacterium sp. TaxID=1701 RepID=UPI002810B6DA|nr:hypothetical protein [Brevibacterium sp.]